MIQLIKISNKTDIYGFIINEDEEVVVVSPLNDETNYLRIPKVCITSRNDFTIAKHQYYMGIDIDLFKMDIAKNCNNDFMAKKYGVSTNQIARFKIYFALKGYYDYGDYTDENRRQFITLYNNGYTTTEIAENLGIQKSYADIILNTLLYFKDLKKTKISEKNMQKIKQITPKSLKKLYSKIKIESFIEDYDELTQPQLSDKYNISISMLKFIIDDLVKQKKIKRHTNPNWIKFKRHPEFKDRYFGLNNPTIIHDYNDGMSLIKMSAKYDIPYNRIYTAILRLISDGKIEKRGEKRGIIDLNCFKEDMDKLSLKELCEKYNRCESSISRYKYNIRNNLQRLSAFEKKNYSSLESQMNLIDEKEFIKVYPEMSVKKMVQYFGVRETSIRKMRDKLVNEGKLNAKRIVERIKS